MTAEAASAERARFLERTACIACGSANFAELSRGRFDEGAVGDFIGSDPWGEHPAPFLAGLPWSYVRCECGQAFHRYILDSEWNERRFSRWMSQGAIAAFEQQYDTPEHRFETGADHASHVVRIEALTRRIRNGRVRVLDFGCGYGEFLAMCALFGFDPVGVDRSAAKRSNGVFPILARVDDVEGTFHALTLFEVLEHLDDPRAILHQLSRLLVPGGVLVLETPDCTGVAGIESRDDYLKIHPLEHINGYTPETLQAFAERLGFVRITPPAAYVTSDLIKVAKQYAKQVGKLGMKRTEQYFRKA